MSDDYIVDKIHTKKVSEADTYSVNCTPRLDTGELVSSVTVVEVDTSDLTISNEAVSTAALDIEDADGNEVEVAIGNAIQYHINATGTADTLYKLRITLTTDSTPARTLINYVRLKVIAD